MFKKMFGGRKAQRTFKVTNVVNTDGCPTKFKAGRYTGNHMSAAKKAFTTLCNHKNVKGKCMFYISIQETTQGSGKKMMVNDDNGKKAVVVKKERHYKVHREKLKEPRVMFEGTDKEYKILYQSKASAVKRLPPCTKNRKRTVGPMKKISRRTNKRKAEAKKQKKSGKKNNKMMNNNMQMNNAYVNNANNANNKQNGGAKRSKNKSINLKNKRSKKGRN